MTKDSLTPERRSEIARNAFLARKVNAGGRKPCHEMPDPTCKRCRARGSEQRSRAKRALLSGDLK